MNWVTLILLKRGDEKMVIIDTHDDYMLKLAPLGWEFVAERPIEDIPTNMAADGWPLDVTLTPSESTRVGG